MHVRAALPLAMVVAAVVLAGCSGDTGEGSSPADAQPADGTSLASGSRQGAELAQVEGATLADDAVTVEAVGSVEGTPEVLTARVGVHTRADSVQAAYDQAGQAATAVRDALLNAGVKESDLQTARVSVARADPERPHRPAPPTPEPDEREPSGDAAGYVARTTLRVTLRDVEAAGATLDEAIAAGGDAARLGSLGFSLGDDSGLLRDARKAAFDRARAKAEQYAELADRSLGELVGVAETDTPHPAQLREEALDGGGPPIEPGTQSVRVKVLAKWALQ